MKITKMLLKIIQPPNLKISIQNWDLQSERKLYFLGYINLHSFDRFRVYSIILFSVTNSEKTTLHFKLPNSYSAKRRCIRLRIHEYQTAIDIKNKEK